jgi:8-oxo-dGTP diphosphatase
MKQENPDIRGAGILFHILPYDLFMFFLRDDIPTIPNPGMIDIIGGRMEEADGGDPEVTARREIAEELYDAETKEPFEPKDVSLFKTWVDERPGEHNIFVCTLNGMPNIRTNEGQGLVFLGRNAARGTNFAYGYSAVVNEYIDSLEE